MSPEIRPPEITVVVITRDRADELSRTLRYLHQLPERPRVIVVDNGSTDGTVERLRADHPTVELVALSDNRGAAGRNLGMALATSRYVAFCDDDTWWAPGSLARAADILSAYPRLALVTGRIIVEPDGTVDPISDEMAASPLPSRRDLPGAPLLSFLAGASVVRRTAFLATGGFEAHLLIGGEEELLAADLADRGWAMAYVSEVEVHHHPSTARDPHLRRRQGIRNTLWFTWLRRPVGPAARHTIGLIRRLPADRHSLAAVLEAAGGAAWVARNRRVVGPPVEAGLQCLSASQSRSRARRYVS